MVLFGLSPLSVVLQREIFLDNIAVMWTLLAFCLAASPSRHLWHHFGAGIAAAAAVLTKETMLVVLPALLVTMWRHSHRDTRKFALTGAITACVLIGMSYPLFALLKGELFPGARPRLALGRHRLPDEPPRFGLHPRPGLRLVRRPAVLAVLRPRAAPRRPRGRAAAPGHLALVGDRTRAGRTRAHRRHPRPGRPAPDRLPARDVRHPGPAVPRAGPRRRRRERRPRGAAQMAERRREGVRHLCAVRRCGGAARRGRRRLRRTALVRRQPHRRHRRRQRPLPGGLRVARDRGRPTRRTPGSSSTTRSGSTSCTPATSPGSASSGSTRPTSTPR